VGRGSQLFTRDEARRIHRQTAGASEWVMSGALIIEIQCPKLRAVCDTSHFDPRRISRARGASYSIWPSLNVGVILQLID
jgi:hypothetical protein